MGAHFEALDEGVLLEPLDSRYTQVGFSLVSVQVCKQKFLLIGAMISHDNMCYSCLVSSTTYSWRNETSMTYLPMSHVAAHMIDIYLPLVCGGTLYFVDKDCLKGKLVSYSHFTIIVQVGWVCN